MTVGMELKVALYLRVSTEDQAKEGYSLEVQEEYLRDYVKREKSHIYKVYIDDGISGYIKDRPALNRLFADAKDGKFHIVLVHKLDRFSRNLRDLLNLVEELSSYGVGFKSATEVFDTTNSAGKLMFQQLGSFAEFERNRIKERVFPGMIKGVMKGNWQGARFAPYGYRYNKKKQLLQVVPQEAEIVKTIYTMYLTGNTTSEITAYLYRREFKTRTGRRFHSKLVCDILKNKVYTGKLVWNRRHYSKKEKTKGGYGKGYRYLSGEPSDVVEAQGRHKPIISDDDFKRVQLRLLNNRKTICRVFNKHEHLLTGIIRCAYCGSNYLGLTSTSNHTTKKRKKLYRCRLKGETRSIECNNKNIVAASYDEFALKVLEKIVTHKTIKDKRYTELIKAMGNPADEIMAQLNSIEKLLKENQEKQKKLTVLYLNREVGQEVYNDSQIPFKEEEDKLKRQMRVLEVKLLEKENAKDYNNLLASLLDNPHTTRSTLSIFEK
jgi:site-specific DNA recombinase